MTNIGQQKERVIVLVDGPQMRAVDFILRGQNKRLTPARLLSYLVGNRTLVKAIWYQPLEPTDSSLLAFLLDLVAADRLFDLVIKRKDIDTDLATDLLEFADKQAAETIILVSGDGGYSKAVRLAQDKGVKMAVGYTDVWSKTAESLRSIVGENFIELADGAEQLLEDREKKEQDI